MIYIMQSVAHFKTCGYTIYFLFLSTQIEIMTENLELAVQLLLVGMLSVFAILAIVTGLARLLIFLVNKYSIPATDPIKSPEDKIDPKTLAIISSVVNMATGGRGKLSSVKKI